MKTLNGVLSFARLSLLVLVGIGMGRLGAQQTCAYSNVVTAATSTATCPLGTFGSGVPFTASAAGMYFCPDRVNGSAVLQANLFLVSTSASGACNYIGSLWPPNVQIRNCQSGSTDLNWCNAAFVQDMGNCPWAPTLPWPKDSREFGWMNCTPYCIGGRCQ
jgi:hypothetical protein